MTSEHRISDEELHAFIDGELAGVRAADIAVLIQYDADLAKKVSTFRADKRRLLEVYGPLSVRPLPASMTASLRRGRQSGFNRYRTPLALAASIVLLIVAGFTLRLWQTGREDSVVAEALAVHHETQAAQAAPADSGALDQQISAALGLSLHVPDLGKYGYSVADVRIYATVPGGAAKVSYRDAANHRFTLYLRHSSGTERFDMLKRDKTRICIWQDDVVGAVMLGEMSAGEMLRIASLAYAQING